MQSKTTTFSLIALCALLGGLLLWRISTGAAETRILEARISALSQEVAAAARQPGKPAVSVAEDAVAIKAPAPISKAGSEPQQRTSTAALVKLNEDLAAARMRISDLESKVLSLNADKAALAQQRQEELTASEETCRTRTADVQRSLEAAQADLKTAQQRAVVFEAENENLRKAQAAAPKAAVRSAPASEGELDELSRRRDGYLKSLVRRYREIDNDYRAFIRDPQGPHVNDPALLRIQATLSQAEEDLRQIDSLNAKTLLVEKRRDKN